ERASPAAPVPRPPQPTRATRIVLSSAAWTAGTATPAKAEAVATWPVVFKKSRRDAPSLGSVMMSAPWERERAQSAGGYYEQVGKFAESPSSFSHRGWGVTRATVRMRISRTSNRPRVGLAVEFDGEGVFAVGI